MALSEIKVIRTGDRATFFSATGNDRAQLCSVWPRAMVKYRSEGADLDEVNAKRCQGVNNVTATLRKPNCVQPYGAEVRNTQLDALLFLTSGGFQPTWDSWWTVGSPWLEIISSRQQNIAQRLGRDD